jgi:hypothetical protein
MYSRIRENARENESDRPQNNKVAHRVKYKKIKLILILYVIIIRLCF